jgi:hypothetical protein
MLQVEHTLIPFRRAEIPQRDLEEVFYLAREAEDAARAYHEARSAIRRALESGARVEPGVHRAVLLTDHRGRTRLLIR